MSRSQKEADPRQDDEKVAEPMEEDTLTPKSEWEPLEDVFKEAGMSTADFDLDANPGEICPECNHASLYRNGRCSLCIVCGFSLCEA